MIINGIDQIKAISSEPVIVDPIYMAVDIGAADPSDTLSTDLRHTSLLNIVKRKSSQRDSDTIKKEVYEVIKSFFGTASRLGYLLDINSMYSKISAITDVVDIYMTRTDNTSLNIQGITLLSWHPAYENTDISIISQNTQYPYYKLPYLFDPSTILNRINVITSDTYNK
tara:strand:- start:824 stop:1330 length:507 start_codon:yes stop_codon:yes gene_type:complete